MVRRGVEAIKADVSRTFFLQRKGWNAWAKALWKRRLARAEEGLARRKKGEVFACECGVVLVRCGRADIG